MKCISNRLVHVLLIAAICSLFLIGCKGYDLQMPYDPDSNISAYRINSNINASYAKPFARDLCVVSQDINTESAIIGTSEAAGLFDVNKHNVIYAKNANEVLPPASITKVMTALLACKYGNMEQVLTASENVIIYEQGAQVYGLKAGDKMDLDTALHVLLMYSANDVGVLIAENLGGSIEGFADMMNREALSLGATNTHFVNPHGLNSDEHYTTVYDLYLIFKEAMKYDKFCRIINTETYNSSYTLSDGTSKPIELVTGNRYLNGDQSTPAGVKVIGGKTGTTKAAGNCLILLSVNDAGDPFISVVLKANDREELYGAMTSLLANIE